MPTVVVCSDEFGPLGRAEAEVLGMAGLPLVAIPHPLAGNDPSLVGLKAEGIVAEIEAALCDDVAIVTERYSKQFLALTQRRLDGGAVCIDDVCAIDSAIGASAS